MAGFIFNLEKESEISQEYQYLGFVFVHGGWRMEESMQRMISRDIDLAFY